MLWNFSGKCIEERLHSLTALMNAMVAMWALKRLFGLPNAVQNVLRRWSRFSSDPPGCKPFQCVNGVTHLFLLSEARQVPDVVESHLAPLPVLHEKNGCGSEQTQQTERVTPRDHEYRIFQIVSLSALVVPVMYKYGEQV